MDLFIGGGSPRGALTKRFLCAMLMFPVGLLAEGLDSIDHYLDQIDSEDFFQGLSGAAGGDPYEVDSLARMTTEIQYLLAHVDRAIPKMVMRLGNTNGIHFPAHTRILYFIVFKHAKDPRALPVIADYFDSLPDRDERQVIPVPGTILPEHCGQECMAKLNKENTKRWKNWDPNFDAYQYALFAAYTFLPPPPIPAEPVTNEKETEFAINFFRSRHQLAEHLRTEFKRRLSEEKH